MNDTKNIEKSFRDFLQGLNHDNLTQNEARIILVGNNMFFGFLNIVFDFHETDSDTHKIHSPKIANILDDISKTDSKLQKTIKIEHELMKKKPRTKYTQSAEGKANFVRSNPIDTKLYRNHFLCSLLSDLLVDLFLPQRSRHYLKFRRGRVTSPEGGRLGGTGLRHEHPAALVPAFCVQVQIECHEVPESVYSAEQDTENRRIAADFLEQLVRVI